MSNDEVEWEKADALAGIAMQLEYQNATLAEIAFELSQIRFALAYEDYESPDTDVRRVTANRIMQMQEIMSREKYGGGDDE